MKQLTKFWSLRKGYCLFALFLFASCGVMDDCPKEQIGDVRLSLNVTPDGWNDELSSEATRASYSALAEGSSGNKTFNMSFTSGDAIGLFACDKDGKVVIANHKWSYSGSAWTTETPIEYITGMGSSYTYFAYYPWVSSLSGAPALNSTPDISSAEAFFASAIMAWTPAADQSTVANFTGSDLMVGKGTTTMPYFHEVSVSFIMSHQMGLAVTQPSFTFYDINDPSYTWTVTQSFTGNIPYQIGSNYYYLVKPGVETTIGAKSTTLAARQVEQLFFTNMEPGRVERSGNTMTIHSGKVKLSNPITYQYSTDGGSSFSSTKPSWLTVTANVIEDEPTEFEVSATPASATSYRTYSDVTSSAEAAILKTNTAASNVDLSMVNNDGSARMDGRTTANCYLVHAPGSYKIPLVYGNAIKDGNTNRNAYYTTKTSNTLRNFYNHKNQGIYTENDETDPWLKNHSFTVAGAKLVWQDVQGMISSVGISDDYLTFTVDPNNIAPGNAVIAATTKANGTGDIVWSWHIWVTTETLSNLTTISADHTYQLTPVNVGWISSTVRTYKGNTCRVQASSNGITLAFDVTQADGSIPISGYCPYYQWGRKDALIPSTGSGNYNHNTWDIDGNVLTSSANNTCYSLITGANSIGTTIKNPISHYYNSNNNGPYNQTKYNYWDAENTAIDNSDNGSTSRAVATVKTVYDPCPPDFCVPTSNCFYYIYSNYSPYFKWTSSPAGRTWTMNGANVFFPASGYRYHNNGTLGTVNSDGYYWTATPYGANIGRRLNLSSNYTGWETSLRAYAIPVRAVAEE